MKAYSLIIVIIACSFSTKGVGQVLPLEQNSKPKNAFLKEWAGGAKGALICYGAGILITGIVLVAIPNTASDDELAFGPGLLPLILTITSIPSMVSWGVNRSGEKINPNGKYWHALAGSLLGAAVSIPINSLIYSLTTSSSTPLIVNIAPFILDPFVIIPIASVLAYNLLGRSQKSKELHSVFNIRQGALEIGNPIPVVYPNRLMQGNICAQISLLKITF